jgi:His/Glu/Gln/Arg/opine family amino acid ABC transporter permease subunit
MGTFARGLEMTFKVSIIAELFSLAVGLVAGIAATSKNPAIFAISRAYIEAFRAIPLLVGLIWIYYGVSIVTGIEFTAFTAGILGLGLNYGAYLAEVFRAGLQAIPKGQAESALTLGLTRAQVLTRIVLPQAVRIIIPPLGNSYVSMLKDCTLVSVLGITELFRVGQTIVANNFRPFEIYTFIALVYLVLTIGFSRGLRIVETRIAIKQ